MTEAAEMRFLRKAPIHLVLGNKSNANIGNILY
jgi:hypothetical protein